MQSKPDAPRLVRHLIIIESAGKIPAIQAALRRSPIDDFQIIATGGHLFDLPASLSDVGVDRHLRETGRKPKRPQQIQNFQQWAQLAQRVLVACDADQEGDVLAWDIAELLEEIRHPNVARIRLRSLDREGVLHAFLHPEPVRYRDAWPGTARRMLDRLIGSTYGQRDGSGVELSVGRVQSAMLGAAAAQGVAFAEATIALPSCDGKEPFVATVQVTAVNLKAVQELVEHAKEFSRQGQCMPFGKSVSATPLKPWNYGQSVLAIAQATARPIDDVSRSMQRLYEAGRMSYPRSDASAITPQGIAVVQAMAEQHGVRFDASRVPAFSRQERHAHESPRILQSSVNITAPLLILSDDEAALSLIARHLLACGQPHAVHSPNPAALPDWAAGLKFERKVCQWLCPWPRKMAQTGLRVFPNEEIALALLLRHKLGRPSTMVFHALKFASRELLDAKGKPSAKAQNWIQRTPELLRDPKTSLQIEKILSASMEDGQRSGPPAALVRSLLESMSLWDDVCAMLQKAEAAQASANQRMGIQPS